MLHWCDYIRGSRKVAQKRQHWRSPLYGLSKYIDSNDLRKTGMITLGAAGKWHSGTDIRGLSLEAYASRRHKGLRE